MYYQEFNPGISLSQYVDRYAVICSGGPYEVQKTEKIPAKLHMGLVFSSYPEKARDALPMLSNGWLPETVTLPHNNYNGRWQHENGAGFFVVLFKPGVFDWLFPYPVLEFVKTRALRIIKERPMSSYYQLVASATSMDEQVVLSNKFLAERVDQLAGKNEIVQVALKKILSDLSMNITSVANDLGVSGRHFRRVFSDEMEMQPKDFQILVRISASLRRLDRLGNGKLSEVAYECGFFDQSHFDNSFKKITGITPTQYLNNRTAAGFDKKKKTKKDKSKNQMNDVRFFLSCLSNVF